MRRCEIIARFARPPDVRDDPRLPLFLLIATDVVSEGLNLQGASVLVHLDLPWTPARIEQRVGRVRRLGAEHALVNVYAIAPPAHELSTVLRALQRKSRIVSALGIPASHSQRELLGSERHPMHRATKEAGLTDLVEAVRSLLRTWMIPAEDAALVASGLPICCGLCGRSPRAGWQALVLAETGGRPRLAALSPVGLDEHPREILRVARLVPTATEPQGARCSRELRAARSAAVLAGRQWVAELRGSALAAPALDASSLAHAKALRRIAVLMLRAPRHERSALADVASRCRLLLRTARGSGVERALTNWLETPAASLAMMPPSARVQLDALATLLRPFGGSTRIGEVNAALHALIVLVRA
jgi:hypothetical protein